MSANQQAGTAAVLVGEEHGTVRPDYNGGGIANLMASIVEGRGGGQSFCPPLELLPPASLADRRNVILMVIDGLGYELVSRQPAPTTFSKHLRGRLTSVFPSTTATAITTFLTGEMPQQHGLTGWFTYFGEIDEVAAVLPFQIRGTGTSLANQGVVASEFYAHTPVFDKLQTRAHIVSPEHIAKSA